MKKKDVKCIVKVNDFFEVVSYNDEIKPNNLALEMPDENTGTAVFQMSKTNVKVQWSNGTFQGNKVWFSYKGVKILYVTPQMQSVCDYMNKFASISKHELDELVNKVRMQKKSDLEIEIEKLEAEKLELKKYIQNIIAIKKKKKELDELINEVMN